MIKTLLCTLLLAALAAPVHAQTGAPGTGKGTPGKFAAPQKTPPVVEPDSARVQRKSRLQEHGKNETKPPVPLQKPGATRKPPPQK